MRKNIIIFIIILLITIPSYFIYNVIKKPLTTKEDIHIEIAPGENLYGLLDELKNNGDIKSVFIIKGYLTLTNSNKEIIPGTYTLSPNITLNDLIKTLNGENGSSDITVTIPEGYRIDQIAETIADSGLCSKDDFIKAIEEYPVPTYINTKVNEAINIHTGKPCEDQGLKYSLEGYLYPDTYKFAKNTLPNDIIKTMLTKFEEVIVEAEKETGVTLNKEKGELSRIITKASMIERECKLDKERAIISSVMINREAKDMEYQMDATTQYAQQKFKEVVTVDDTHSTDSAYNTYVVKGLPPGPIASPGIKSIIAAIKPSKTDYIFYVLNPKTKEDHYFTNNYDDFIAKQREWGYID